MTEVTLAAQERGRADLDAWLEAATADPFETDPFFQSLVQRYLGKRQGAVEHLREVSRQSGARLDRLVRESSRDANLPYLRRHDPTGRQLEEVVFHPTYHEAGRVFWGSRVLAVLAQPGNDLLCGAIAYLLARHGEAGHACPVACTAGAIKLLQRLGTAEQQARYLPGLLDHDYDRRLHAAQFVTEVQGGSDVGLNACVAVPEPSRPGWYRIRGEKWFCSVADAGLFVVSARVEGAAAGTRGLGLFLVPRALDGAPNGFVLRRLKDKLGTRSMPTGEIELDGALGEAIGPLTDGFRNLVGIVLDTSRAHNAIAASGMMRRAFTEAHLFAAHRRAFEHAVLEFPAAQEILARMRLRSMAALATTLRVLEMGDRLDTGRGDDELRAARRISVMVNKLWTALACTQTVRDAIEMLGGNGTIEELSVLPRLYRDAIVVESWEGTHNTLCAQVLRDFRTRSLHRPWLEHAAREIAAAAHPRLALHAELAHRLHADVERRIGRLLESDDTTASAHVRHVIERACRLTDWLALLGHRQWELEHEINSQIGDALQLYRLLWLEPADPQEMPALMALNLVMSSRL